MKDVLERLRDIHKTATENSSLAVAIPTVDLGDAIAEVERLRKDNEAKSASAGAVSGGQSFAEIKEQAKTERVRPTHTDPAPSDG